MEKWKMVDMLKSSKKRKSSELAYSSGTIVRIPLHLITLPKKVKRAMKSNSTRTIKNSNNEHTKRSAYDQKCDDIYEDVRKIYQGIPPKKDVPFHEEDNLFIKATPDFECTESTNSSVKKSTYEKYIHDKVSKSKNEDVANEESVVLSSSADSKNQQNTEVPLLEPLNFDLLQLSPNSNSPSEESFSSNFISELYQVSPKKKQYSKVSSQNLRRKLTFKEKLAQKNYTKHRKMEISDLLINKMRSKFGSLRKKYLHKALSKVHPQVVIRTNCVKQPPKKEPDLDCSYYKSDPEIPVSLIQKAAKDTIRQKLDPESCRILSYQCAGDLSMLLKNAADFMRRQNRTELTTRDFQHAVNFYNL